MTAAVLDGAVLIQIVCPGSAVTIRDHFTDVFVPYVLSRFETNNRVDIVWDVYFKTSLKSGTQEQRGSTERRRQVTFSTKIPSNRAAFLRVDLNKQEFFVELAKKKNIMLPQDKQLFTTILGDAPVNCLMLMLVQSPPAYRRNLTLDYFCM